MALLRWPCALSIAPFGAAATARILLLRRQPGIGFDPVGGGGANPSLRSREGRDVDLTGLHIQPRLAVGDMSARQAADSFSEEKNQMLHLAAPTARRRRSTWGKRARRGQADYGRATPSLRQPAPGAILILIVAGFSP